MRAYFYNALTFAQVPLKLKQQIHLLQLCLVLYVKHKGGSTSPGVLNHTKFRQKSGAQSFCVSTSFIHLGPADISGSLLFCLTACQRGETLF